MWKQKSPKLFEQEDKKVIQTVIFINVHYMNIREYHNVDILKGLKENRKVRTEWLQWDKTE
jgi:hypothetical protein